MNTFKMSPYTLFNLACDIIDCLEEMLSTSLSLTDEEIYAKLENNLGYSLTHIRDTFKIATNISLSKYITRRKYTNILLLMSRENFESLTMHAELFGIRKFKSKCLREFPLLVDTYSPEHMQLPIDKSLLPNLLRAQIIQRNNAYFLKPFHKNITKGRTPFEIKNNAGNIIIQTTKDTLVDLEKTYFVFEDKIFKITADLQVFQRQTEIPFLSMFFGHTVYSSYSIPINANMIVHTLHQFLTKKTTITSGFSIFLEFACKHSFGNHNLISLMTFDNVKLQAIEFIDKPFLLFDNQNVFLDLSFFDKYYPK